MATRRIGGATLRSRRSVLHRARRRVRRAQVAEWEAEGVARVWCHGFSPEGDGYPRYIGTRGMSSIAKHMAIGLGVQCGALTFAIRRAGAGRRGWDVVVDDGTVHHADAVVSTCPLAQTFSLLFEAGVDFQRELVADDYDRTIALLAVLDGAERGTSARRRPAHGRDVLVRGRQRDQGHQRRSGRDVARRAGVERAALGR